MQLGKLNRILRDSYPATQLPTKLLNNTCIRRSYSPRIKLGKEKDGCLPHELLTNICIGLEQKTYITNLLTVQKCANTMSLSCLQLDIENVLVCYLQLTYLTPLILRSISTGRDVQESSLNGFLKDNQSPDNPIKRVMVLTSITYNSCLTPKLGELLDGRTHLLYCYRWTALFRLVDQVTP